MGRRSRRRGEQRLADLAPETAAYDGLELRIALSPGSRRAYAGLPGGDREDAWHRRVAFLWERLAARWEVAGVTYAGDRELRARWAAATPEERAWVRARLREHCAEHFPELDAP